MIKTIFALLALDEGFSHIVPLGGLPMAIFDKAVIDFLDGKCSTSSNIHYPSKS